MMSPIPVLPDITGDITSPSPHPWCGSGAGQGRTRQQWPAALCRAEPLEVRLSVAFRRGWQSRGTALQAAQPPETLPVRPGAEQATAPAGTHAVEDPMGWRIPQDGGSHGMEDPMGSTTSPARPRWSPTVSAPKRCQSSALSVPARWGQMCALPRLPRYIWPGVWFPSRRSPHPPSRLEARTCTSGSNCSCHASRRYCTAERRTRYLAPAAPSRPPAPTDEQSTRTPRRHSHPAGC